MIEIKHLFFKYKNDVVLQGIDLQIPKGSLYGYLGKNGAGKTTTLKLLLGLLPVPKQTVFYDHKDFATNRITTLQTIGNLIETPSLYEHLTCFEQLNYMNCFYKMGGKRIDEVLEITGMSSQRNKKIKHCSTGMKQRLAIGMALFHNPEILILDEPMNGLDPNGIHDMRALLLRLHDLGVTILFSSHILSEIEKNCTHVAILNEGKICYQGGLQTLLLSSARKIAIYSSDNQKSMELISKQNFDVIFRNEFSFMVSVKNRNDYHFILKSLIDQGVEIYNIENGTNNLEELFLTLTTDKYA
ncbi:MAG: ATP-binding cassette domain-containing protein [Bacteroidales bacterium]|jgi:ABC-2 type transport system ATP-binding protein|nr:ATP-binding cassette domain-containing protein [Bacteroidales bacterium]